MTVLLAAACSHGPAPSSMPDPAGLTRQLAAQFGRSAEAWNRGDLDGFMSDYAADTLPTFISRGHLRRGFDFIRSNYEPAFRPGARRDSLRFEEFNVRPVGADYALVTARYILYRNGETTASGPFTLLMQHRPEGWRILHDHSSSDTP